MKDSRPFLERNDTYSLRGIAMLMIIISHTYNGYPIADASYYYPSWLEWLHIDLWSGMGVGIFLFLSGYGLFLTLTQRERIDRKYVSSKCRRLFEPYVIYWIVEILVLALLNRHDLEARHILTEITTFSIHPDVENWFFKVIVVTYVLMLLLFKCPIKNGARMAIIATLSLAYLLLMKELGFGQWWYNNILCFAAGAFVAYKYAWFEKLPSLWMSAMGVFLMLAIYFVHMNLIVFHLAFVLFCIYAVRVVKIQNRLLYFIGFNSFIFYFIECPVMDEITIFCYSNFPVYCILSVLMTCLLSYLCVFASKLIIGDSR